MLRHPWTTGERASRDVMEGVDEKLAAFQQVSCRLSEGHQTLCKKNVAADLF